MVLNHTSLFEWLFAGSVPNRLLRRIAFHAVVPVADKTLDRPLVGRFFRFISPNCVRITREADHTWQSVLAEIDADSMLIIFPEGRMKRANGLDKHGRPMTVRGGIADILRAHESGPHADRLQRRHAPHPGARAACPVCSRPSGCASRASTSTPTGRASATTCIPIQFKRAVRSDLQRRRDLHCPPLEEAAGVRYPPPPAADLES